MRYKFVRLDIVVQSVFAEPAFNLPQKAGEVLERFYKALRARHPIKLDDLRSFGGSSYADVKLVVTTFAGKGQVEIAPSGLVMRCDDLVQSEDDLKIVRDFLQLCDESIKAALQGIRISQRTFRANMWLDCEGGAEAAGQFLDAKGNAAFKLDAPPFAECKKEFTLRFSLSDEPSGVQCGAAVERSRGAAGHLFVACFISFDRIEASAALVEQFDQARKKFEELLRHIGLAGC